jgi:hypothetical protein
VAQPVTLERCACDCDIGWNACWWVGVHLRGELLGRACVLCRCNIAWKQ